MEESQTLGGGERKKNVALITVLILFCVLLAVVLVAVLIPKGRLALAPMGRIECPGFDTAKSCREHGCTYEMMRKGPACHMGAEDKFGYNVSEVKDLKNGKVATLVRKVSDTPYGPAIPKVLFEVTYLTENIVRVKLRDADEERYEVPVQQDFPLLQQTPAFDLRKAVYDVYNTEPSQPFSFQVKRKDGTVLWDTSIGGMVMSDQFLQIVSYLPSQNIYGLGEHVHDNLRRDLNYVTWPLFARDQPPVSEKTNLYGVHPFYTCLENNTKSHGVLLLNSNAMEVTLLPDPAVSFRTIGGVLDLFFIIGNNPEHVTQLYTSLVGRPVLPPLWSLGFQLSRYGYNNMENVSAVVERTRKANIAQAVQFLDIDHMKGNRDFTFDEERFKDLIDYIKKTQKEYGLKWIIILDPAIEAVKEYEPYESGVSEGIFVKRGFGWDPNIFPPHLQKYNITYGKVWPNDSVAFPDFFNPEAKDWWSKQIYNYHYELPFDGLWIDMNEPSNFGTNEDRPFYCEEGKECWVLKCPTSPHDDPPYNPLKKSGSERLSKMTLCMDSIHFDGKKNYLHYDVHSLYGWSQTQLTLRAAESATNKRSLVITRSTYPSSGRYAGHWLGDNKSTWEDLRRSIIGMLEFNLFGIPYIGADVCGFFEDTTEELCKRWMQLGAFYPFFRNHNGMGQKDQDPVSLGEDVTSASRAAVKRRYTLLPYLYTLFYNAHINGNTVVRPLFHEFPSDENTLNNWAQFMWGRCLLISPILAEGADSVNLYLPPGEEWWLFNYNNSTSESASLLQSGAEMPAKRWVERKEVSDNIPLHVRGGCIIPTQPYKMPNSERLLKKLELFVFLRDGEAEGEIFLDDGESKDTIYSEHFIYYKFKSHNCTFSVIREGKGYDTSNEPLVTFIHFFVVQFRKDSSEVTKVTAKIDQRLSHIGEFQIKGLPSSVCST